MNVYTKQIRERQKDTAITWDDYAWQPAILRDDPMTSVRAVTPAGMVPNVTAGQAIDVRDLFLYGDQFRNYTIAVGSVMVTSPRSARLRPLFFHFLAVPS